MPADISEEVLYKAIITAHIRFCYYKRNK